MNAIIMLIYIIIIIIIFRCWSWTGTISRSSARKENAESIYELRSKKLELLYSVNTNITKKSKPH